MGSIPPPGAHADLYFSNPPKSVLPEDPPDPEVELEVELDVELDVDGAVVCVVWVVVWVVVSDCTVCVGSGAAVSTDPADPLSREPASNPNSASVSSALVTGAWLLLRSFAFFPSPPDPRRFGFDPDEDAGADETSVVVGSLVTTGATTRPRDGPASA
jgi:hypothetical protein